MRCDSAYDECNLDPANEGKGFAMHALTVFLPVVLVMFFCFLSPALLFASEGEPLNLAEFGQWMVWTGEKLD
ncbi:MAG: hypothetical protein ACUVXJ_00810 [Phycisphaerae bacterium]